MNVVKIDIKAFPGDPNPKGGQNPYHTFAGTGDNAIVQVQSASNERALQSSFRILGMVGPKRISDSERGREHMLVGYIQLLTATTYEATYGTGGNEYTFRHAMDGDTYVDTIWTRQTVFPWYDAKNVTSQGTIGNGLLLGRNYVKGHKRQISMSDSPYPFFPLSDPHPNRTGGLKNGAFDWDFELIVAVGTIDVDVEHRDSPLGDRYPFFRRATARWEYSAVTDGSGNGPTAAVLRVTQPWQPQNNGQLAFDQEVFRDPETKEPIRANEVLNHGKGDGIWFEQ